MPSPLWAASWGSSIRYLITFHSVFSRCLHSCSRRIARQPSERRRRLVPHRGLALLHGSWGTCEYSHLLEKIVAGAGEGNRTLDIQLGKPCSPVALACRRSPLPRASENPGAAATATRGGISDKQHISSTRRCQEHPRRKGCSQVAMGKTRSAASRRREGGSPLLRTTWRASGGSGRSVNSRRRSAPRATRMGLPMREEMELAKTFSAAFEASIKYASLDGLDAISMVLWRC